MATRFVFKWEWRRLSLVAACAAALVATPSAQSRPQPPLSKDQAVAYLRQHGYPATPLGLLSVLETAVPDLVDIVRAFISAGVAVDRPVAIPGTSVTVAPLNYLLEHDCRDDATATVTTLLLEAGANANLRNPDRNGMTPAMEAVRCPAVLAAILAKKPDFTLKNNSGNNVMQVAISSGDPRDVVVRMLLEAGFDPKPQQRELLAMAGRDAALVAILTGAIAGVTSTPTPPVALDWKSVGPFPQRSAAEATRMLARPGTSTTIDEHFRDGISSREPLRLALAIQAGANVQQRFPPTGYTPLVLLAERCDERDPAPQVAVAELLKAAKADAAGVDTNKSNALVIGARHCPAGVLRAFIGAGVSLTAVSTLGETPLRAAIRSGRADAVEVLLAAGVDLKKEPYNVNREVSSFGNKEMEAVMKRYRK